MDNNDDGGGGKSRASKKRARAKQKKSNNKNSTQKKPNNNIQEDNKIKELKKIDKENELNNSVNEDEQQKIESNKKRKKDKKACNTSCCASGICSNSNSNSLLSSMKDAFNLNIRSIEEIINNECTANDSNKNILKELNINERSQLLFEYLLNNGNNNKDKQITIEEFFELYWEKKILHIIPSSNNRNKLDGLLNLKEIENMIKKQPLQYGIDLNVTNVNRNNGKRITLDEKCSENDSSLNLVKWNKINKQLNEEQCTIRLLCPHKYNDNTHSLLSILEHIFGSMVGCNAYLTPSNQSQGFAPHYDDIDAFVLQLNGAKHWKIYGYKDDEGKLPRDSSNDFTIDDIQNDEDLELVFDGILNKGDVLYMPRGFIHYAITPPTSSSSSKEEHSLHLTVSASQHWSWADYLETLIPTALQSSIMQDSHFRSNLPNNFLNYMGIMHDTANPDDVLQDQPQDDNEHVQLRNSFHEQAKNHILHVCQQALTMLDHASDEMAKRFILDRQPPSTLSLTTLEEKTKSISNHILLPTTLIKLLRPGIARLVFDNNDKVSVYHCCDNDRTHNNASSFTPLEFEIDDAPAIEQILTSTDEYIAIKDLIHESDDIQEKIEIVNALMKEEILDVKNIGLDNDDDEDDDQGENDEEMQDDEEEEVGF